MATATTSRNQLLDEIYDQFLICKICYELYKRPKTLQCLHTFCTECLEKHQDAELERSYRYLMYTRAISCPICRKKTELPSGGVRRLPDNFLVANLGAVISRRLPETKVPVCEICKPGIPAAQKLASSRCLDCAKLLCKHCVELHQRTKVTQQHSLFDIEIEKDIECKVHEGETVRFYCELCEMCICVVCTFQEHKGHEVSSFAEGMKKHQSSLDNLVDICKERIDMVKEQLDIIYKCESEIKNAEESIRDMAIDTISEIRDKEQDSVKSVYDVYGEETLDFIREKSELQEDLDNLQSTCNLTDIVVKDKGMELLLLKKEIQGKLQNLLQRQVRQPPENAMKQVKFIPGNCVFGYLSVTQPNGEAPVEENAVLPDNIKNAGMPNGVHIMDEQMHHGKGMLKNATSQTETEGDTLTTMGNLLKQICDQRTQTRTVVHEDRGSSPISCLALGLPMMNEGTSSVQSAFSNSGRSPFHSVPSSPRMRRRSPSNEVRERYTMTQLTPTLRRKVQTCGVETYDEGTSPIETPLSCNFTNKNSVDLSVAKACKSSCTDTIGLIGYNDMATATTMVYMSTTSTCTDSVAKYNKSTEMPLAITRDKMCGTARICQTSRETMTKYIATLDMGVTASVVGEDKGCGTRAIVTMHTSCGESDVRTQEQASETPWKEEYVKTEDHATMPDLQMVDKEMKTDPLSIHDKDTYTSWFNMQTKGTETTPLECADAAVTVMPQMKTRGLNTQPLPTSDKALSIQTEFLPRVPQTVSCLSQTQITLDMDIPSSSSALVAMTTAVASVITSAVSCQTSPQVSLLVTTGSDSYAPQMVHKQFGSRSVLYIEESIATSSPNVATVGTHTSPCVTEMSTSTDAVQMKEQSTDYIRLPLLSVSTSTPQLHLISSGIGTDTVVGTEMSTMTPQTQVLARHTSMGSNVEAMDMGTSTNHVQFIDRGEQPIERPIQSTSTNTSMPDLKSTAIGTEHVTMNTEGTSTNHSVTMFEKSISTDEAKMKDSGTCMNINYADQSTHTAVLTADVGVLKRPHSMSRGVSTKRTKLMSSSTATDEPNLVDQITMTNIVHGNRDIHYDEKQTEMHPPVLQSTCIGTPHFDTVETCTEMPVVLFSDRMSSPVIFSQTTERGCSPIDFQGTIDRSCSPIIFKGEDKGVHVQAKTTDCFTSTICVEMQDTGSNYDRPMYVDKQNSPVRNLISTRTKFTSTPHVTFLDRAGSPILTQTSEIATNTAVRNYVDREASPLPHVVKDTAIMATVDMVTQSAGTPHITQIEEGTETVPVRVLNSSTEMPVVSFVEKETSTLHIHVMHKNISTENIETRDQSTAMAPGVAASYMELVAPPEVLTVTRGTCTHPVVLQTKETSPPPHFSIDRASSPVRALTADKGITANKAVMLDTKDTFQAVGKNGTRKPLSGSRATLECIREDEGSSHSSEDDGSTSSKDTLPDIPPLSSPHLSPRLRKIKQFTPFSEGRPQMGLGFGNMANRDRYWSSSPSLGASSRMSMGASMINHEGRRSPCNKLYKTETSTNTKGIPTESRSTSTSDIVKMDKAVCTEAVTMQGKIGECISKLKTVRQRLEQQPQARAEEQGIYSLAKSAASTSETQSQTTSTVPLLAIKSKSVDSRLDDSDSSPFVSPLLKRHPTMHMSFSSASTSDSYSESSDQEQHARSRADRNDKARRMRLNINQLLRSTSLPESPEPPAVPHNSPMPKPKLCLPQILPRINPNEPGKKSDIPRPSSAGARSKEAPPGHRERPKSATERTKDRPMTAVDKARERALMARSVSRERVQRQNAIRDSPREQPKPKAKVVKVEQKPPVALSKDKVSAKTSPRMTKKAKPRPTARFDESHPLLPSSPRNTRRMAEANDALKARLGESPKQRRERLEKEMTFEDRKALTKQYFQETRPASPGSKAPLSRSARSSPKTTMSEKPPKRPTSTEH